MPFADARIDVSLQFVPVTEPFAPDRVSVLIWQTSFPGGMTPG